MNTPLTARHLKEIADELGWSQQHMEEQTGIVRTNISTHLSCKRPIRDEHLAAYIRMVPGIDKVRLLTAWIRDVMHEDDLPQLLGADDAQLQEEASSWLPPLNDSQRGALQWLAAEMVKDRELDDSMQAIIHRLGYEHDPSN